MRNNLTSIAEHSDYLSASTYSNSERWISHRKRVKFGKQLLELWMFVPCKLVDGVWVVMKTLDEKEEWFRNTYDNGWWGDFIKYKIEYKQAKEMCLFEGFEIREFKGTGDFSIVDKSGLFNPMWKFKSEQNWRKARGITNVENMVDFNLQLTQTAQKQI